MLRGPTLRHPDLTAARWLWELLGAEAREGDGRLRCARPDSPLDLLVEAASPPGRRACAWTARRRRTPWRAWRRRSCPALKIEEFAGLAFSWGPDLASVRVEAAAGQPARSPGVSELTAPSGPRPIRSGPLPAHLRETPMLVAVSRGSSCRAAARRAGVLLLLLVLAGGLLAAPAAAAPETTAFPGTVSTVVDRSGDGAVPSLRYRGAQRFDTARLIAEDSFGSPADVLLARADIFPDALAASFLAGHLEAPLLLTESRRLTPDTRASLSRLDPRRVVILGGTDAVAQSVADELAAAGYAVERTGGADRFATARLIATRADTSVGSRDNDGFDGRAAIVARADEFPDALVAGMVSYASHYPLLLTTGTTLHRDARAALDELGIETVIIPGGTAAVSDRTAQQIEAMGITVDRIVGQDRVATSVEFAYFVRDQLGFELRHINMARGDAFPDALTLGPHAGEEGNPIVLTADHRTLGGGGSVAELLAQTCEVHLLHVAGGHLAVSTDLEQLMREEAVDTGAVCDVVFDKGNRGSELIVNPLSSAPRTVEGTVTDNAGEPSVSRADVRWQVFRGDLGLRDGVVELADTGVTTTDSRSRFSFEYAGSNTNAWDYVVACTTNATTPTPGEAPDSCLRGATLGGTTVTATQLLVRDAVPQNVADGLAWSFQIKQWGDEGVTPVQLEKAEFCDFSALLSDEVGNTLTEITEGLQSGEIPLDEVLCEGTGTFGDAPLDFIRLTFDGPVTELVELENDATMTLTAGGDEVEVGADFPNVVFVSTLDALDADAPELPEAAALVVELVDDLAENQVLALVVNPEAVADVPEATSEHVVDLDGITDTRGNPVVVGEPRQITDFPIPDLLSVDQVLGLLDELAGGAADLVDDLVGAIGEEGELGLPDLGLSRD